MAWFGGRACRVVGRLVGWWCRLPVCDPQKIGIITNAIPSRAARNTEALPALGPARAPRERACEHRSGRAARWCVALRCGALYERHASTSSGSAQHVLGMVAGQLWMCPGMGWTHTREVSDYILAFRRTAPSPPTSTPSPWPPAPASTTTSAPSRGRMAPPPPSPSRIPTSRPSTAPATKCAAVKRSASYGVWGCRLRSSVLVVRIFTMSK